jgi:hypothetical protein
MKKITAATLLSLLLLAAGCGSSVSKTSPTSAGSSPSTAAGGASTTTAAASGMGTDAFCSLLASETEKTAGFAAAIGTPQQAAKVAEIKAANDEVLAAAPPSIHAAIAKVYAVSEIARKALDTTLTPAQKRAAGLAAAAAVRTPGVTGAIARYKAWVTANCGGLAPKILSGGL